MAFENSPTTDVRSLYERRPYPHYPLLAKPRWQDGYLGSSMWAKAVTGMASMTTKSLRTPPEFLSVGSGEMLPYIIRQWEPSGVRVTCVDLSGRSLRRAAFRTALLGRKIQFYQGNIDDFLLQAMSAKRKFHHMEAYGVLHHISAHRKTLQLMREALSERGLLRVMIYNSYSREWIWQINRAFKDLGISYTSNEQIQAARQLIHKLATISPKLSFRLDQIGRSSLNNNSRFADTFLHPWESRATIEQWFELWRSAGLRPIALYDRYAELDDLPNPLWRCPTADQLTSRSLDLRFENNLEVWLCHDRDDAVVSEREQTQRSIPLRLRLRMPPSQISRFSETSELTIGAKLTLWQGFLRSIHGMDDHNLTTLIKNMELTCARRLARVGLITPTSAKRAGLFEALHAPMTSHMTPPTIPISPGADVFQTILPHCAQFHSDPTRVQLAARRLVRAL
jgi:hypothetical protein